jgi:Xaa-Pro aminopeptidase
MGRSCIVTRLEEVHTKRKKVHDFLGEHGLDAIVFENQSSFAWYTAGGDSHVGITTDQGVALLVITREADFVVTTNIEAPRIAEEEIPGLGLELVEVPWHEPRGILKAVRKLAGRGELASDSGFGGTRNVAAQLAGLRFSLTEGEIDRYRSLGRDTEESVRSVCKSVRPGMTENSIAGMVAQQLYSRGVTPVVLLIAADDRIEKFRHPINTDRKVRRCAMIVSCGRRHGLIISCTRLVHFGKLPPDLRRRHDAVLKVDAAFNLSTRVGREIGSAVEAGIQAYAETGFPEEWKLHHQGGPTGYVAREFRATPDVKRKVVPNQAFAWNPSIAGTKSEDTILVTEKGIEFLSLSTDWPMVDVEFAGRVVKREDILVV